jgi:hypothetical protein
MQSLICLENSRHNKFCFYLPTSWPAPVPASDPSWKDGTMAAKSEEINNGIYALWFNKEDDLQVAVQRSDTPFTFGFQGSDINIDVGTVFYGLD